MEEKQEASGPGNNISLSLILKRQCDQMTVALSHRA
jgi:hypothetical protein